MSDHAPTETVPASSAHPSSLPLFAGTQRDPRAGH